MPTRAMPAIVKAILGLAEALGLEVVAEGVETSQQLAFLRNHGCVLAQGYLFGRPTPDQEELQHYLTSSCNGSGNGTRMAEAHNAAPQPSDHHLTH